MLTCYICRSHYSFIRIGTFFFNFMFLLHLNCFSFLFQSFSRRMEKLIELFTMRACAQFTPFILPLYPTQGKTLTTERENQHKKETTREVVAELVG
jgi:hypothetical protein